jgi:hypothetical protein
MQNKKLSIRKIVSYLNDEEAEAGGFWLPNIQRPFVWGEDQIARLYDSIMREYPISTLLVWKTKETVKHRKFIDNYRADIKLSSFFVPDNSKSKLMVLDGQQRLQGLFIGLRGSYEGKELFFDVLSGTTMAAPEDIRFRFAFKNKENGIWPWIRFKDIVSSNKLELALSKEISEKSPVPISEKDMETLQLNISRARHEFVNNENLTYQELDGIDNPDAYQIDDIVEIFIRANSGGTKLGKSDLLFSLLTSSWEEADEELESLLDDLNKGGFAFDRDFILKSCLTMLGKGARYEVSKFRDGKTKEEIIDKWESLSAAIKAVRDMLVAKTYIRSDRAMPSYQGLIPLIYFRFHNPAAFSANNSMSEYLLRVLVTGAFSGSPDNLIDKVVKNIQEHNNFILQEVFGVIRAEGRSLDITPDVIYSQSYGSRSVHLFFNLWYSAFNYSPALNENGPQVDHIFPQSLLKSVKDINPDTGKRNIMHYRAEHRDQIANCMLLTAEENGFSNKTDIPPSRWFSRERFESDEAHKNYLELHLIPNDEELWKLENFEKFIEARKELIKQKFSFMLQKSAE